MIHQVYELLRLDAEHAVQLAQQSRKSRALPAASLPAAPEDTQAPVLLAIYGQGQHLLAELRFAQQSLLFKSGHKQEIGRHRSNGRLKLKRLDSRCAVFEFDQQDLPLCLGH